MVELYKLQRFVDWLDELADTRAEQRIVARLRRLTLGNPGDVRPVGGGVSEMRIDWGPGYRVYFVRRGPKVVLILGGGTKATQSRDIAEAQSLARLI